MVAIYLPDDPQDPFVLHLLGETTDTRHTVDHGYFWAQTAGTGLGSAFCWDAWVKLLATSGYLISDGYGGAHALLWGFNPAQTGNIWGSGAAHSFSGSYGPAVGEWAHAMVLWTSGKVYTFVNGICDGMTAFAGPREAAGLGTGAGRLYVGGSDHLNLACDLAYLRGYDRDNSLSSPGKPGAGIPPSAFTPDRFPGFDGNIAPPTFVCDYTRPGRVLIDLAPEGIASVDSGPIIRHHGRVTNLILGTTGTVPVPGPLPRWVVDPTCPFGQPIGSPLPAESIPSPGSVPGGAKIFDSFGRRNQTLAFQLTPTLGSTEGGSLGPKTWSYKSLYDAATTGVFGLLGGAAVPIRLAPCVAWVASDSADMDVRVSHQVSAGGGAYTGLCFRVADESNYWYAITYDGNLYYGNFAAGVDAGATSAALPGSWTTLRAVTSGTSITLYADTTSLASLTSSTHQTAVGAGLSGPQATWMSTSLYRYRDFTVF